MFYDQMFNPAYNNQNYYQQNQAQIAQYQQNQNNEVYNAVKGFHDWFEAMKKLDPQHQNQAMMLCLAEVAQEQGWK
ncbi:hypothetical protein [Ruminococcus sp.]|uniref:hypothetical protein n=1 Tax=Ruminococcus sp. TaxID=41978 RepID=UPI0025EC6008|nr:hypothetical protein [Ruminococcus sp.]MBR1432574.1 hypothetical protein [Ruminococcus sp.]